MDIRSFFSNKTAAASKARGANAIPKTPAQFGPATTKTPSTANANIAGKREKVAFDKEDVIKSRNNGPPSSRSNSKHGESLLTTNILESEEEMELDDGPLISSSAVSSGLKRKRDLVPTREDRDFVVPDDVVQYVDEEGEGGADDAKENRAKAQKVSKSISKSSASMNSTKTNSDNRSDVAPKAPSKSLLSKPMSTPDSQGTSELNHQPVIHKRKKKTAAKASLLNFSSKKRSSHGTSSEDGKGRGEASKKKMKSSHSDVHSSSSAVKKKNINAFAFMRAAQKKVQTKTKPATDKYKYTASVYGSSLSSTKWSAKKAKELPEITEPQDMFDDMVSKVPQVKRLAERLGSRPIRVATMCSGTEAPILALEMISKAAKKKHGVSIGVESVFSCEIEEYKQAYIERNFAPPILFRDAEQLQFDIATTAYGAEVPVPGGVDILIAGTSCKDASSLNNHKQDLRFGSGESTRTYRGMLGWVTKHRPGIVVLENVCGAPWRLMCEDFNEIGYQATYRQDLDTKKYYCPQTRTRGYLVAMRTANKTAPLLWNAEMVRLERQSSATIEAFLLENDDPRVLAARNAVWSESKSIEWTRCQSRHTRERFEGGLGERRPVTNWIETGQCVTPNHWWKGFINQQTHRVHDTIDTNFLRQAVKRSRDSTYKAEVWDLSQNVDRQSFPPDGLTGCLTPSGCAFLTCRGGPIIGVETLKLQGLPVDDIMLSCESEPQLRDFAGNAMTTTVVGAAMLCALVVATESLPGPGHMDNDEDDEKMYSTELKGKTEGIDGSTTKGGLTHGGMRKLVFADVRPNNGVKWIQNPMDLSAAREGVKVHNLVVAAGKSAQACHCEGRFETCSLVRRCCSCHVSVCIKCAPRINENHVHNREPDVEVKRCDRIKPVAFLQMFRKALPMRIHLLGFGGDEGLSNLQATRDAHPSSDMKCKPWNLWTKIVTCALKSNEFRFAGISRGAEWSASYRHVACDGAVASLCLTLLPSLSGDESRQRPMAVWTLSVEPPPNVTGSIRLLLSEPIARMTVDASSSTLSDSLTSGEWEVRLPLDYAFQVTINSVKGTPVVPSWKASLGLKKHLNDKRHSSYSISVAENDKAFLSRDISGIYTLLPSCEAAEDSLYIRRSREEKGNHRDLYFFVDPEKCGPAEEDHMVFSESNRRLSYGETRSVVAKLDPSWRPSRINDPVNGKTLNCKTSGIWTSVGFASTLAVEAKDAVVECPPPGEGVADAARVKLSPKAHETPTLVASCSVTAEKSEESIFDSLLCAGQANEIVPVLSGNQESNWVTIKSRSKTAFKDVRWLTSRLDIPDVFKTWHEFDVPSYIFESAPGSSPNEACAPTPPELQFVMVKNKLVARENPAQAGPYEQALKNRPDTFLVQISKSFSRGMNSDSKDALRVGVNAASLAFQTIMQLPSYLHRTDLRVSWRLVENNGGGGVNGDVDLPRLKLISCRGEPAAEQPPSFSNFPLRPEQLRSLAWMQKQERTDVPYYETALEEAVLNSLDWRAECKAQIPIRVRGGILGDQVGYGKTAITLAMIDSSRISEKDLPSITSAGSRIPTKCTLIVVPSHLPNQWALEVKKFVGPALKTAVVKNLAHLNNLSIHDIQTLDVLIVSETLLRTSDEYWYRLACLSGAGRLPPCRPSKDTGGVDRRFGIAYAKILAGLQERVAELSFQAMSETEQAGVDKVVHAMHRAVEVLKKNQENIYVAPEVLHGKDLRETARLEGEWMKSLDKAQRVAEEKKKATSKRLELQAERRRKEERQKIEKALKGIEKDPWKLQSAEVRKDWRKLKCPPLELFHWNRVVVDEFTYLEKRSRAALHFGIKGTNRWALSGTPPISNFHDVKSIAASIGVHLGVNGKVNVNSQTTTALEKLQYFQNVRTPAWKAARHTMAQQFLDRFVRQNIAEIDEIHAKEYIWHTQVTAAEKAVYLELKHHLEAMDMNLKGGFRKKTVKKQSRTAGKARPIGAEVINASSGSPSASNAKNMRLNDDSDSESEDGAGANDKDTRMAAVLKNCKSAEEALIKRAATFDLEGEHATADEECAAIEEQRERQLGAAKLDFIFQVRKALGMRQALIQHDQSAAEERQSKKGTGLQLFNEWLKNEQVKGDADADKMLSDLVGTARNSGPRKMKKWIRGFFKLKGGSKKDAEGNSMADRDWELREHIHHLRRLQKEILDRVRSLRYFKAVRVVQDPNRVIKCVSNGEEVDIKNRALLSCCGHQVSKSNLDSHFTFYALTHMLFTQSMLSP